MTPEIDICIAGNPAVNGICGDSECVCAEKINVLDPENPEETWLCVCGNVPSDNGFYPCNTSGEEIDPSFKAGWRGLAVCGKCGRIINSETLCVVGKKAENVSQYWLAIFHESLSAEDDSNLSEFPLDSVCGEACKAIVNKASELLSVCDPHIEIRNHVLAASLTAIQIVCFG